MIWWFWFMVLNATFNNISVLSWWSWAGFSLTTLVVIITDRTICCKSNYHTITTTTVPIFFWYYMTTNQLQKCISGQRSQEAVLTPGTDLHAALIRKFRYHRPEHKVVLRNDLNLAICYHWTNIFGHILINHSLN